MDCHDMIVIHRGGGSRLTHETPPRVGARRQPRTQHLDRHHTPQRRVESLQHHSEPATANYLHHFVGPEPTYVARLTRRLEKMKQFAVSYLGLTFGLIRRHTLHALNCRRQRSVRVPDSDRKSTRLNSSHLGISYAVFCLKKKKY